MKDELQDALTRALTGAIDTASAAQDFVLAELPDVVSQLLWWKAIESFASFCFGVVFFIAPYYIWKAKRETIYKWWHDDCEPASVLASLVLSFTSLMGLLTVLGTWDWIQILVAPKIYLIEYAAWLAR